MEYLNTLLPSELPPHRLTPRIDAPTMLLRNISSKRGLANGTRLIVKRILSRVIDAELQQATGRTLGSERLFPDGL